MKSLPVSPQTFTCTARHLILVFLPFVHTFPRELRCSLLVLISLGSTCFQEFSDCRLFFHVLPRELSFLRWYCLAVKRSLGKVLPFRLLFCPRILWLKFLVVIEDLLFFCSEIQPLIIRWGKSKKSYLLFAKSHFSSILYLLF